MFAPIFPIRQSCISPGAIVIPRLEEAIHSPLGWAGGIRILHRLPLLELEVLQQDEPLGNPRQTDPSEDVAHDERAGEATRDVAVHAGMDVGVVPVESRRMIGGQREVVVVRGAGSDVQKDVVAGRERRHLEAVIVDVGAVGAVVLEMQPHLIAGLHAQDRRHVEAVVERQRHRLSSDGDVGGTDGEGRVEHARAAADLGRFANGTGAADAPRTGASEATATKSGST
jgi:hypothetical protein